MRIHSYILTAFLFISCHAISADYKAREQENLIQLKTPYGEKTLIGDYSLSGYRIEIPIEDLTPERLKQLGRNGEGDGNSIERNTSSTEKNNSTTESKETRIIETHYKTEGEPNNKNQDKEVPPRIIVEYDDSDRLVLEANRLFNNRKFHEALSVVDELLRRKPTYIRGWIMRGSLMYVKGHKDLAHTAWRKAESLDPENQDIKSIIAKYK